ncbi:DUF222 domain-containing protein [Streptomyces sp. SID13031]|uniref:DUF222 domain-containing protein n=1 Tax=Streptomyces sp. SID13031 TaxID=2706046 RepID=UPI0013C6EE15|nr:DUF222 domain-containing protein [Streptomyces sp. SID13031]NEA35679.1 DUF222 domain-containing protein [Streptomyces sp. SID13031]
MDIGVVDREYGGESFAAEVDARFDSGAVCAPEDPESLGGPRLIDEVDVYGGFPPLSAIDALEWELWAGVEQDEAERTLLEAAAPAWVFLPPGPELAAALAQVRPQTLSPMALIELMKATARLTAWTESIRMSAMASFYRQRKAQAVELPRPSEIDSSGRPVDPERSWAAEIACALKLSAQTVSGHIDTALRLTGVLAATHSALRCGAISLSKAIAISDATRALDDASTRAVEAAVLQRAPSQSHANLRKSLRGQVAKYNAKNEADRHREAKATREVRIVPLADGMAGLWIVNTADKIQEIWIVIQAMANLAKRHTPSPTPTPEAPSPNTPTGHTRPESGASTEHAPSHSPTADSNRSRRQPTGDSPTTGNATINSGVAGPETSGRTADDDQHGDAWTDTNAKVDTATPATADDKATTTGQTGDNPAVGQAVNVGSVGKPVDGSVGKPVGKPVDGSVGKPVDGSVGKPVVEGVTVDGVGTDSAPVGATDEAQPPPGERLRADHRTADQRRADVVTDLFDFMLWNGLDWLGRRLPDQHRRRPHIEVLVPITTLLGMNDEPCELTGYGPIPAEMARTIATDSTWRRILTDPTNGTVLEASTTRHDPGMLVSETLLAAHPTCDWPNCNRAARECDRDHGIPFTQTGLTRLTDLRNYCELHHVIKDTPAWGWAATNNPDGSTTITTPTGHRYTTPPATPGPIHKPSPTSTPNPDDPPPF